MHDYIVDASAGIDTVVPDAAAFVEDDAACGRRGRCAGHRIISDDRDRRADTVISPVVVELVAIVVVLVPIVQAFFDALVDALRKSSWVQKEAAKLLDVKPTTLNEMIKRHDIRPRRRRGAARRGADDGVSLSTDPSVPVVDDAGGSLD
ncbi:MAG TPA: hypothetical protein EYQ83_20110 [Acidobacteria bacterium]|nr:hypothetical protein [Acidobacteriota bacterium]